MIATEPLRPVGLAASAVSLMSILAWKATRGLAPDGWHGDDAWVVSAVSYADSPRELVELGFTHPGFNALLRVLSRGADDQLAFQAVPALAGMAALVALLLMLRQAIGNTAIAWVMLLPLASSALLFRYSVAVKPYTIEILVFAAALFVLQRCRPVTNRTVLLWLLALLPFAAMSFRISFISAVTGFGLYWGKKMTLRQLLLLAAGHAVILGPLLLFIQSKFSGEALTRWWDSRDGVFINDGENPVVALVAQFHRATRVILDWPAAFGWVLVALVLIGAAGGIANRKAAETAAAAALVLAVLLSALRLAPFGPDLLAAQRIDLWLAPALLLLVASGAITLLKPLAAKVAADSWQPPPSPRLRQVGLAALVIISIGAATLTTDHRYPDHGFELSFAYALAQEDAVENAVMVGPDFVGVTLQLAAHHPEIVVGVQNNPRQMRGIRAVLDPPLRPLTGFIEANGLLEQADRVIGVRLQGADRSRFRKHLRDAGFVHVHDPRFRVIDVFDRPAA